MTSRKSSTNPVAFTFFRAIRGGIAVPLAMLAAFFINYALTPWTEFIQRRSVWDEYGVPHSINLKDFYQYIITISSDIDSLMIPLTVIASVALAIVIFRFIASKKTVNVYYSLGIKRTALFSANYFAGAAMLTLALLIPFLFCFFVNIGFVGFSATLLRAVLYYFFSYLVLSLTAFTVTAVVFTCVGTIIEGIGFSAVMLASPILLIASVQMLMYTFVNGAPYGRLFYLNDFSYNYSLWENFNYLNPVFFPYRSFEADKLYMRERSLISEPFAPLDLPFGGIIIWGCVSIALFFLGKHLFKRRKTEICGFLGMCKPLTGIGVFAVGFTVFAWFIYASGGALGLIGGLFAFAFIFSAVELFFGRSFKLLAKRLKVFPIHLAVGVAILLVFVTGFFGFEKRIPAADSIESVDISMPVSDQFINLSQNNCLNSYSIFDMSYGPLEPVKGFTSENDIGTILDFHQSVIDAKADGLDRIDTDADYNEATLPSVINLSYHLKDGSTMYRYYDTVTIGSLEKLLALTTGDKADGLTRAILTDQVSEDTESYTELISETVQNPEAGITFVGRLLGEESKTVLSPEKHSALLSALADDLTAQTVQQRFFPDEPALGIIRLEAYNDTDAYDSSYSSYTDDIEISKEAEVQYLLSDGKLNIVITKDMKKTVALLEKYNLLGAFGNVPDFTAATVTQASVRKIEGDYAGNYIYMDSLWFTVNANNSPERGGGFFDGKVADISDAAELEAIVAAAQTQYFCSDEGYLVRLISDSGVTSAYVKAEDMPQSVVEKVKVAAPLGIFPPIRISGLINPENNE